MARPLVGALPVVLNEAPNPGVDRSRIEITITQHVSNDRSSRNRRMGRQGSQLFIVDQILYGGLMPDVINGQTYTIPHGPEGAVVVQRAAPFDDAGITAILAAVVVEKTEYFPHTNLIRGFYERITAP